MNQHIYMIDTLSPFFLKCSNDIVNWSKVPFDSLESKKKILQKQFKKIRKRTEKYFREISDLGYNAVSIDDLAHLIIYPFYPDKFKKKLAIYRKFYRHIFKSAIKFHLKIYLNTDIMFYNQYLENARKHHGYSETKLLTDAINMLFKEFKNVEGVIFRIGEADGVDVKSEFKSKVTIRKPEQLNKLLKVIINIFEQADKTLIVRTWTMGAYPIGDLIWNPATFTKAFSGISSDHLIISMKYGEGDFFRYLATNPLFAVATHRILVELQTRREYEGHGSFPSYVGYDYQKIYKDLENNKQIAGIHVWCQTGGWSSFINRTFSKRSSVWNEINTYCAIRIFKDGLDNDEIIRNIAHIYFKCHNGKDLAIFLRFSDLVVKELLYDPGFASHTLYLYRVRIPPLLYVFWDTVTLNKGVFSLFRCFNEEYSESIIRGRKALHMIKAMRDLARRLNIEYDYHFHYRTFLIIFYIRKLLYYGYNRAIAATLKKKIKEYRDEYPWGYTFKVNYRDLRKTALSPWIIKLFVREERAYRWLDRIIFSLPLRLLMRGLLSFSRQRLLPTRGKLGMAPEFFLR